MSDNIDEEINVEVDEPEIDIAVGPEPEAKPEVVSLSPAEFAALKAQGDSAQAIQKGIAGLGDRLATPQYAPPTPANTPVQSAEEFLAEHSDDLFDKEKAPKLMAEFNKRFVEREYGPVLANMGAQLASAKRELLAARDPQFKKYEAEVDRLVKSQPLGVQAQPDIYERAWLTVKQAHQSEIEDDSINAKVDARLKELGIDPATMKPKVEPRPDAYTNSASRSVGSAGSTKRTIRLPDEATKKKYEREAAKRGLDLADYLRTKGY